MKKETVYECFKCRNKHSVENVSPTCAKCVYDQTFALQKTILEQGRLIDLMKQVVYAAVDWNEHYEYPALTKAVAEYKRRS